MDSELSLFAQERLRSEEEVEKSQHIPRGLALVALSVIGGVGHQTAVRLFDSQYFDCLFSANRDEILWIASQAGVEHPHAFADTFVGRRVDALEDARDEYERFEDQSISVVLRDDPLFPRSLREIPDAPRWLFVRGNVELLSSERLITVVGTRQPSQYGVAMARRVTSMLVKRGFAVVSGLAEGIDKAVHDEVLRNKGQTIAVLGTGLSNNFPQKTENLRTPIVNNGGAIITEYFDKESYSKQRFVLRNRIQAALSRVLVPVEASVPSGTLHTVRFAKEFGRTVVGVKAVGFPETPFHQMLREEGFDVVEVPEKDDPFMAAIGAQYDYAGFSRDSQVERRLGMLNREIRRLRAFATREHLTDYERKRIAEAIQAKVPS